MKGLIKEFLIVLGITFLLYFLFTKTPLQQYSKNLLSGFFSYFQQKEERIIYFNIELNKDSQFEIKDGKFDLKINGILREIEIDKILLSKNLENVSEIFLKCEENCILRYYSNNIDVSAKINYLNLDDLKFSSKENLNTKIKFENLKNLNILITSDSINICLTNSSFSLIFGNKKIEQKIYNDCLILDKIIKVNFVFKENEIRLEGYANNIKSTFLSI
ncbi:MAG: hypothetical protein QW367_01630 [Candidatus Aenigmatarchaeota archaeon]